MRQTNVGDKKSYLGMLVITWILIFMTLPFLLVELHKKEILENQLTECEKMCYPNMILEDGEHYCSCKPQIKSRLP